MLKKTILFLFITLSLLMPLSCSKDSDKEVLIQRVNSLVDVIENHDEKNMKNYFSEDFSVAKRFNKEKFFLFVHYQLKRNKNISITFINKEIRFNKSSADITADILVLGANKWLPERGQRYSVESRWINQDGEWVMSRLRWVIR